MYLCEFYDCGWCYADDDKETTASNGACNRKSSCPQAVKVEEPELPPINLNVLMSADNFYKDKGAGDDSE